jgi:hypothetical protein
VNDLKNLSAGKPLSEETVTVGADGRFEQLMPFREDEVCLLLLDRK